MSAQESVMTPALADLRVRQLKAGQSFVYYRGHLSVDRHSFDEFGKPKRGQAMETAKRISDLGDVMLRHGCRKDYALGDGCIVDGLDNGVVTQRRIEDGVFEYLFTKR